jgi:hypothetical protein
VWWFIPIIPATQEAEAGGSRVGKQPGKTCDTLTKNTNKRAGAVAQVAEHLLSLHEREDLGSIPSTAKKKKRYTVGI